MGGGGGPGGDAWRGFVVVAVARVVVWSLWLSRDPGFGVEAAPQPQWGVEAAADAANSIDAERFEAAHIIDHVAQNSPQQLAFMQTPFGRDHQRHNHPNEEEDEYPDESMMVSRSGMSSDKAKMERNGFKEGDGEVYDDDATMEYDVGDGDSDDISDHLSSDWGYLQQQLRPQPSFYYRRPSSIVPTAATAVGPQYPQPPNYPVPHWGFWKWGPGHFQRFLKALFS